MDPMKTADRSPANAFLGRRDGRQMPYAPPGAGHYREPTKKIHPVAHRLRKRRYELNLSTSALADRAGYSQRMVERWETGQTLPRLDVLTDWAQALGARLNVEFDDVDCP